MCRPIARPADATGLRRIRPRLTRPADPAYQRRPEDERSMFLKTAISYLPTNLDRQPVEGNGACVEAV